MHSRARIGELLEGIGRTPRRDLGQNFLADANTARRIVHLAAVDASSNVVEIGAGLGSLTLALAATGAAVRAVEVDEHLLPTLRELTARSPNVEVIEADALRADWGVVAPADRRWSVVANLPYNVATTIVIDLLDDAPQVEQMLVMVQREVAERLCAAPGSKTYGATSVRVRYHARAHLAGVVPATVFVPRPNVESALVAIERRDAPAVDVDAAAMFELVRAGFAQRRKMLRRSLAGRVDDAAFAAAGVEGTRRPEELDVAEWAALTNALAGAR